ncbi:MAG: GlsB/YeaQ/YmgE family stress response membrane protein [Betaproteobacteria bacterium]|jgi:uncharacterized membrane protein YeaQ/YmgE (transglycosylase-associated protein family)
MGIISWLVLGLVAGFIGSKIVNKTGEGLWLDIALGIVGAIVGGVLFSALGMQGVTGLNLWSMIVAVVGAVVVLFGYHAVAGRR